MNIIHSKQNYNTHIYILKHENNSIKKDFLITDNDEKEIILLLARPQNYLELFKVDPKIRPQDSRARPQTILDTLHFLILFN